MRIDVAPCTLFTRFFMLGKPLQESLIQGVRQVAGPVCIPSLAIPICLPAHWISSILVQGLAHSRCIILVY